MQKEQSFVNQDLNTAFVDGQLNKTVSNGHQNTNWNLLDDPNILHEEKEEQEIIGENILDFSEKQIKEDPKKIFNLAQSSLIRPKSKPVSSTCYKIVEDDDDLKDLYQQFFVGKNQVSKNK